MLDRILCEMENRNSEHCNGRDAYGFIQPKRQDDNGKT